MMNESLEINFLDVFLIVIVLFFAAQGFKKGFFRELIGFVGIIIAVAIALYGVENFAHDFSEIFKVKAGASTILVFFLVFFGVLFLLGYIVSWINKNAHLKLADAFNKALGGGIGLVKGVIISSLLAMFITVLPLTSGIQAQAEKSVVRHTVIGLAPFVYDQIRPILPDQKRFVTYLENVLGKFNQEQIDSAILKLMIDLGSTRFK